MHEYTLLYHGHQYLLRMLPRGVQVLRVQHPCTPHATLQPVSTATEARILALLAANEAL